MWYLRGMAFPSCHWKRSITPGCWQKVQVEVAGDTATLTLDLADKTGQLVDTSASQFELLNA